MCTRVFSLLLAWLIALGCIFTYLGQLPLIDPDEGRNAEIAREMKNTHSFVVPLYNGLPRLDKPAFFFNTVALSFNLFGENETAARLPSAFFAVLTLAIVSLFCWHIYDLTVAALAVLILGTTPLFIAFSRTSILDMQLTFFLTATLFAGYIALENLRQTNQTKLKIWALITVISAAFGTLIKGPIGFILPTLGLFIYVRSSKIKGGKYFFSPLNMIVFFAIVLLWFFAVTWIRPDFAYYGLLTETFERFFSIGKIHRSAPIYYYIPVIFIVFFPWSLLLAEVSIQRWQQRKSDQQADRLLAIFTLVVVLFFSISRSKLPGYILPAIVAMGILIARVFSKALKNLDLMGKQAIQRATVMLFLVSSLAASFLAFYYFDILKLQQIIQVHEKIVTQLTLLSSSSSIFGLLLISLSAVIAYLSRNIISMLIVFSLTPIILAVAEAPSIEKYAEQNSSRRLAQNISTLLPKKGKVVCYKCMPTGLPFYLGQHIIVITADGSELTGNYIRFFLQKTSQWPEQIIPFDKAFQWLALEQEPLLLLVHKQYKPGKLFAMINGIHLKKITSRWLAGLSRVKPDYSKP